MDCVLNKFRYPDTDEPRYVPDYTGHCPQAQFRQGANLSKISHQLFTYPGASHSPKLILTDIYKANRVYHPTQEEYDIVEKRKERVDAVYDKHIAPGYEGFIPRMYTRVGERFGPASIRNVAEFETLMEDARCKRRHLEHTQLLDGSEGLFSPKPAERTIPMTTYQTPLLRVMPRAQAPKFLDCDYKEPRLPYSKFTSPLFLECDDSEKLIIYGYNGHIPCFQRLFGYRFGLTSHDALCDFLNIQRSRRRGAWCQFNKPTFKLSNICPLCGDFIIYRDEEGMIANYGGHVPGASHKFACTFQRCTKNGKHEIYVSQQKMQKLRIEQGLPQSELYAEMERECGDNKGALDVV